MLKEEKYKKIVTKKNKTPKMALYFLIL